MLMPYRARTMLLAPFALMLAWLGMSATSAHAQRLETAVFAGGCFWCVENDFDKVTGVVNAESGYTGGSVANPSYEQVSAQGTGHREAVRIRFDPAQVSYATLVATFLRSIDAIDNGGQFCDRGFTYSPAIYALDVTQARAAQAVIDQANAGGGLPRPITLPIERAGPFYMAEARHQDYARRNPLQYTFYRGTCGRDRGVNRLWGDQAYLGIKR